MLGICRPLIPGGKRCAGQLLGGVESGLWKMPDTLERRIGLICLGGIEMVKRRTKSLPFIFAALMAGLFLFVCILQSCQLKPLPKSAFPSHSVAPKLVGKPAVPEEMPLDQETEDVQ